MIHSINFDRLKVSKARPPAHLLDVIQNMKKELRLNCMYEIDLKASRRFLKTHISLATDLAAG
jgi:hypothetical protein